MSDRTDTAEAVQDCVEYAFDDDQPLLKIADFISILKESGWSDADIDLVKTTVLAEWERRRSSALN